MKWKKNKNDLGLKIGSKLERFWTSVRDAAKARLEDDEYSIILQKEVIRLAEEKIEFEQKEFRKT